MDFVKDNLRVGLKKFNLQNLRWKEIWLKACVFCNCVLKITLIIWEDWDRIYVRKPFQVIIRRYEAIQDLVNEE